VKDLREKLERVVNEVRMAVLQRAQAQRKAESEDLTEAAELQGIMLRTKPELMGPGGGSH
jgi:hypothetical protein